MSGNQVKDANGERMPKVGDRVIYWLSWGKNLKPHAADLLEPSKTQPGAWNCGVLKPAGFIFAARGVKFSDVPAENCLTWELPEGNIGQEVPNPKMAEELQTVPA